MTRRAFTFRPRAQLIDALTARAAELGISRQELIERLLLDALESDGEALKDAVRDEYRSDLRRRLSGLL